MRNVLSRPLSCAAILSLCIACSSSVSGAVAAERAHDWPQWRGPDRDGKSPDVGLLKRWPSEGPRLVWKRTGIGVGFSSVAVSGSVVYITGHSGNDLVITAFDMNGGQVWKTVHGPGWRKNYPGSRGTPTVEGGNLYIMSGPGLVGCYDAKTGAKKWTVNVTRDFGGRTPGWGYAESVLIYGNAAVVTPGGRNCIVALNKLTGDRIWTSTGLSDPAGYGSCIAFTHQGVPMIANMTMQGLVCVSPATGAFLWRNDRAAGQTAVCPSPVYSDGYVFGASGYGNGGACVRPSVSGGSVTATQAWETKEMDCQHGGYVIVDGYIYGNHGRGWNCLDLRTGEKKWNARGVGKGSICYADGMLYTFGERGGRVGLVPATPNGLSMAGSFSVGGNGPSWAHPVVVGGRLYLRYDDNLYVYDVRGANYRPPPSSTTAAKPKPKPTPRPRRTPSPEEADEKRAESLLSVASMALRSGQKAAARSFIEKILEDYPDTKAARKAKRLLEKP